MRTRTGTRGKKKSRVQRAMLDPCLLLVQIATPYRSPACRPGSKTREGGRRSPCYFKTLPHLVSLVPASRRQSAGCCAPWAKEQVARRSRSSLQLQGTGPPPLRTPCSPRSLRPVLTQSESADPNPNAFPVIFKSPRSRIPQNRS